MLACLLLLNSAVTKDYFSCAPGEINLDVILTAINGYVAAQRNTYLTQRFAPCNTHTRHAYTHTHTDRHIHKHTHAHTQTHTTHRKTRTYKHYLQPINSGFLREGKGTWHEFGHWTTLSVYLLGEII